MSTLHLSTGSRSSIRVAHGIGPMLKCSELSWTRVKYQGEIMLKIPQVFIRLLRTSTHCRIDEEPLLTECREHHHYPICNIQRQIGYILSAYPTCFPPLSLAFNVMRSLPPVPSPLRCARFFLPSVNLKVIHFVLMNQHAPVPFVFVLVLMTSALMMSFLFHRLNARTNLQFTPTTYSGNYLTLLFQLKWIFTDLHSTP